MKGRRKLTLAFAAAALSLGVASAAGIDNLLWDGAHTRAVVQTISDPLSVLDARSPGARRADALRQTKPGHARSLAALGPLPGAPEERVLPSLRDRPPEPDLARGPALLGPSDLAAPDAAPGGPLLPGANGTAPAPGLTPAAFTPGNFGTLAPPGGLLLPPNQSPPGGTPPGGSPPGGSPPGDSPPGGSPPGGTPPGGTPPGGGPPGSGPPGGGGPVPEPAAWTMMIMAMFAVGAALRHQRRDRVNA